MEVEQIRFILSTSGILSLDLIFISLISLILVSPFAKYININKHETGSVTNRAATVGSYRLGLYYMKIKGNGTHLEVAATSGRPIAGGSSSQ